MIRNTSCLCVCDMKMITPAALLRCLVEGADEVHVDPDVATAARASVQRMIEIGQPGGGE